MNRAKTLIKYQLHDYRNVILIMYLCVYLLIILTVITHSFNSSGGSSVSFSSVSGLELITVITILVAGLTSFKENFKFFSANGISRKTQLYSTAAALGTLSAIFALIDTVNCVIFRSAINYIPWFLQIYAPRFGYSLSIIDRSKIVLTPQILIENFLWLVFTYFFIAMISYFITILYYRMNKGLKIAVSIVIPLLLLDGIQPLDYFFNGRISAFIQSFINAAWGIASNYNPYIAMVSTFLFAAFFAALAYLLARRAVVKK